MSGASLRTPRTRFNPLPIMPFFNNTKSNSEPDYKASSDFSKDSVSSPWDAPAGDPADPASDFYATRESDLSPFGESSPDIPSSSNSNVLNSDVTVIGTLRFTDDLLVDGIVEGEIVSDGVLTVGANAKISGTDKNQPAIRTKSAIIHGKVIGNVVVSDRVELSSTAELQGDVTANSIAIQEGAQIVGHVQAGANLGITAPLKSPASSPRKSVRRTSSSADEDASNLLV